MRDVVRAYIEKYRLLTENRPVLVGVSGGADSIALLTILVESGYSCIAAHCNFHLRGDESLRDEQFVREYARKLDVPFLMTDFDTRKYAADRHLSIEMAAREVRYGWFEEQRAATGAQAVAVAHHRDDSVETLLMNLLFEGRIGCFQPVTYLSRTDVTQIRPLLYVKEQQVRSAAAKLDLPIVHNPCPANGETRRQEVKELIESLSMRYPDLKQKLFGAMQRYPLYGWDTKNSEK